jgi:hypothetical protein
MHPFPTIQTGLRERPGSTGLREQEASGEAAQRILMIDGGRPFSIPPNMKITGLSGAFSGYK